MERSAAASGSGYAGAGAGAGVGAGADPRDALGVLEFWKEFDLDGRRAGLDKQCTEMREAKTASIAGRKKLNELTKSFRALPAPEQAAAINDLLKTYQKEIDQLSNRSKLGEGAFFSLYKAVYEAPDPSPAIDSLSSSVMESSAHQLEIEKLQNEIKQYDDEFQQLKNQDITIRRLEDQIEEFKDSIQDKVEEEVSRQTLDIETEAESKIMDVRAAHYGAEKRLATALEDVKQARDVADRCQSQLYELSDQGEKRVSALRADMSILEDDAERLRSRVAELERQLETHSKAGDRSRDRDSRDGTDSGDGETAGGKGMDSILSEFQSLQILADELRQELRRKEDEYRTDKARSDTLVRDLTMQLAVEKDGHQRASADLAGRPSAAEGEALRRQLRSLQRIAFNAQEDNEDVDNSSEGGAGELEQLETLLVARLKVLEKDLTEARSSLLEAKKSEKSLKAECETLRGSVESSAALVARLEADLEVKLMRADRSSRFGGGGGVGVVAAGDTGDNGLSELLSSDDVSGGISRGADRQQQDSDASRRGAAGGIASIKTSLSSSAGLSASQAPQGQGQSPQSDGDGNSSSVAGMLQAQRDRYKERLGQVEVELQQQRHTIQHVSNEKAQLESDNLTLYQKIRFLQSSSGQGGSGAGMFANQLVDAVG
jgi:homeobox protein cut-like